MLAPAIVAKVTLVKGPPPPAPPSRMATPEGFASNARAEAERNARYLSGFCILRVGTRGGPHAARGLREAITTEIRRTDAVTALPDGSYAVLLVHSADRELDAVYQRLVEVAAQGGRVERESFFGGGATAGCRRVEAEELWERSWEAFAESRDSSRGLVVWGAEE